MKNLLLLSILLFFVSVLMAQRPPVDCKKSPMFIFDDQNKASYLHTLTIDSSAGIATLHALPNSSGISVNGIGYRLQDKMVYGCTGDKLIRIDGNGDSEVLSTLSEGFVSGDVSPDGQYLVAWEIDHLLLIDLESGDYKETKVKFVYESVNNNSFVSTDIAFNPVSGILYGFDANRQSLARINMFTGKIDVSPFVVTEIATGLPALFFDSYGNLWGISANFNDKFLYQFSSFNGQVLAKIPINYQTAGRADGCSCPGAFNFQKTAYPAIVSHCGALDFIFTLSNRTGQTQTGIQLEDWMPDGVIIDKIVKNPFGGQLLSGVGTDLLLLDNMSVQVGTDSLIVRVIMDHLPNGIYKSQALLKNVTIQSTQPENLLSDDPRTHFLLDSTAFRVEDLQNTLSPDSRYLCPGEMTVLDASIPAGMHYEWNTGSQEAKLAVSESGEYQVEIKTGCESAVDSFHVLDGAVFIEMGLDTSIQIGDSIELKPQITGVGQHIQKKWSSDPATSGLCTQCQNINVSPFDNTRYFLEISNEFGCKASNSKEITVQRDVYVPNVFSPNGDGENDVFLIQSKNPLKIAFWQIFDRWGSMVYERHDIETNDASNGWNPILKNKNLATGVYTWIAEIEYADGRREPMQGDVTVLR